MPVVSDIRAIVTEFEAPNASWAMPGERGAATIVTYSFDTLLPEVSFEIPGEQYSTFNAQQQANFRRVLDAYEDKSGLVFVEVDGPGMINVNRVGNIQAAPNAYSSTPLSTEFFTENTVLGIGTHRGTDYSPGTREFRLLLHEVGHAVGLKHSHEGKFTLAAGLDNLSNTVMTYNLPGGASRTNVLGSLDVKATQYLYGKPVDHDDWTFRQDGIGMKITLGGADDTVTGINGENHIKGLGGDDHLIGRNLNDRLYGNAGDDTLDGGYGSDRLYGGKGDDWLVATDDDLIFGGAGDDELRVNDVFRDARLYGGDGSDRFIGALSDIQVYGGASADRLLGRDGTQILHGDGGKDVIKGGKGADKLYGGGGDDKVDGQVGADVIEGGGGDDLLQGFGGSDTIFGGKGRDDIQGGGGHDNLRGEQSNDIVTGSGGDDSLFGGGGKDNLFGGKGNDLVTGGGGADSLFGGVGRDTLDGSAGDDRMTGGAGADIFVFAAGSDRITDFSVQNDTLNLAETTLGINGLTVPQLFDDYAQIKNGNTVFVFDTNTRLVIEGITDWDALGGAIA